MDRDRPHRLGWVGLMGMLILLGGCAPLDGIGVSNETLAFDRNERPMFLDVWNTNAQFAELAIEAKPTATWIIVEPPLVTSQAPLPGNVFDKMALRVSVDRNQLTAGKHDALIRLQAPGVKAVEVKVTVTQDTDGTGDGLSLRNVQSQYSTPYLVEFSFGVRDQDGLPVNTDVGQFDLNAWEDGLPVDGAANGLRMQRLAARQMRVDLLLDYSAAMQLQTGAIPAMETAAKEVFLPALNEDAVVSVAEFHRDDRASQVAAEPSVNRAYTNERIDAIQGELVQGFQSGAKLFDALADTINRLGPPTPLKEDRYIVLFADGRDTSSTTTRDEVVQAALNAQVTLYAVGYGANAQLAVLEDLTSRTGGELFSATSVANLADAFERITDELGGQYVVRWATLRRDNRQFYPSFSLSRNGSTATYTGQQAYNPQQFSGDVLQGRLRLVGAENKEHTILYLRADYLPRNVSRIRLWLHTATPFTPTLTEAAENGLAADWTVNVAPEGAGYWLNLQAAGGTLPFAGFGPLVRLEFNTLAETPILGASVDNSFYLNGQSFVVEGVPAE